MHRYPKAISDLVSRLQRLPGVGPKTALRFAFALLRWMPENREGLARALAALAGGTTRCAICQNIAEADPCGICRDPKRDAATICVVSEPQDLAAIESTNAFAGRYHVLGGVLSPIDGITPEMLKIAELDKRLQATNPYSVRELILAMDPSIEGEATMLFLQNRFHPLVPTITRLARGLPLGSDLEYADAITLADALSGRREMQR